MRTILLTLLFIFFTLTSSACPDEVNVLYNNKVGDSVAVLDNAMKKDTAEVYVAQTDTAGIDTTKTKGRHRSWLWKTYYFVDRILSPVRDSTYIDVQNYNWCAEVQLTGRFELYNIEGPNDFSMRVAPDFRWRVGPFFGWRFAFLGYNIDIKSLFFNKEDIDLDGSIYSGAFGLDLFYRRVGGTYSIRKLTIGDKDYTDLLYGTPFNGIHQGMTRVSFYYVTNYKHYSHQAAFSQTNRQLKSAGSLLLGLQYAHNTLTVDVDKLTTLLNVTAESEYSLSSILRHQKNDEISLTCGYGYNWVFSKNWLAAGEMSGSLGYLIQENKEAGESVKKLEEEYSDFMMFWRKNISFSGTFRFSVLWNNGPWFAGTQVVGFYYQYGNGTTMTRNLLGSVYFLVGCNFGLPKALRKHKSKNEKIKNI